VKHKVVICVVVLASFACLIVIGATLMTMRSARQLVDCGWPNSFTADRYKGRVVFIATLRDPGIGVVRESFRGLHPGTKYVLIAHWGIGHNELDGRTYYIEGRYADSWITRVLPIVDTT
jgi:hypothetical protein